MGCNVRLDCKDYTDNMKHPDCKKSTVGKNVKKYRGSKKGILRHVPNTLLSLLGCVSKVESMTAERKKLAKPKGN